MNELLDKIAGGMIIGGMALIGYSMYKDDKMIKKYQKMHDDDKRLIALHERLEDLKDLKIKLLEKELEELKAKEAES